MTYSTREVDLDQAQQYLDMLEPQWKFTFQTFSYNSQQYSPQLTKVLHGTLSDHGTLLTQLNQKGAGIFVTVNRTDLLGRKTQNVTAVRAVFVDLDGAPLEPIIDCFCEPHIIVESSYGRWHTYWLVDEGFQKSQFSHLQTTLAKKFNGDRQVKDLPRVMRLPGFYHKKMDKSGNVKEPFMTRIEQLLDFQRYSLNL